VKLTASQALKAVRVFFERQGHPASTRYTRAADGEPLRIFCGGDWCPFYVDIEVTQ
jgi:hypothetical protein